MNDDPLLSMWTIYEKPKDWPVGWVTRRWEIGPGDNLEAMEAVYCTTLDDARRCVPPGLYRLDRDPNDDPKIVETWI